VRFDGYSMLVVKALDLSLPPSVFFSTKYMWMSRVNENLDLAFVWVFVTWNASHLPVVGEEWRLIWGKCSMRKENVCAVWKRGKKFVTPLPLCLTCVLLSLDAWSGYIIYEWWLECARATLISCTVCVFTDWVYVYLMKTCLCCIFTSYTWSMIDRLVELDVCLLESMLKNVKIWN